MDFNTTTAHATPDTETMELLTYARMAHTLQTVALAALVFALFTYVPKLTQRIQLAKLPVFTGPGGPKSYMDSARIIYSEGYQKFKDRVYYMAAANGEDSVVVPLSVLPELRKLPDDVLSLPRAVDNILETKYTKILTEAPVAIHAIKSDLTPALARLNATIGSEVKAAMRLNLPLCDDWTDVNVSEKLVDIITRVSGRVFVGPDLCQVPEYLNIGSNYTVLVVNAIQAVKRVRPWLRPFLVPRLPEIKKLRAMEQRAAKHLEPIVRGRLEGEKNDPNWQKPDDMMQWLMDRSKEHYGVVSVEELAFLQLGLIFAAVHTTSLTATNIIYTLAVTPEYIKPLREEIITAMSNNDGQVTTRALGQMVKLDSYMKEVMRLYPLGLTSFTRRVLKPITLSNGQLIPAGTILEVPSAAVYADSSLYPSASTFDGFRSSKLREGGSATDHARNQFVTTNETNLAFGYSRHACPGRFFATNEIKLVLTRLILEYDIKMPEGRTERWEQLEIGRTLMANPGKTVMLKRMQV